MRYLAIKSNKPRNSHQVKIDRNTMLQMMESHNYNHIALDYFRYHKPYQCDYGKEINDEA